MSSGEDFRPGDRVRVSYEAAWDQDRGTHYWLRDLTDGSTTSVPKTATVELIERADDPSKDLVGTVRRVKHGGVYVRADSQDYSWMGLGPETDSYGNDHEAMAGQSEIVGTVPFTPAAEKQAADELSRVQGDEERPFKEGDVVRHKGTGSVCTVAVPIPFHSSYYEIAPPWTGDGTEEPPAHVKVVVNAAGRKLYRQRDGWSFYPVGDARVVAWEWDPSEDCPWTEVRD